MVFNLETKQVKWVKELDLSTDNSNFRAYMYSSPTVVDLDGDGYMDILVGTSFGLFYAMDHRGKTSWQFPLQVLVLIWILRLLSFCRKHQRKIPT